MSPFLKRLQLIYLFAFGALFLLGIEAKANILVSNSSIPHVYCENIISSSYGSTLLTVIPDKEFYGFFDFFIEPSLDFSFASQFNVAKYNSYLCAVISTRYFEFKSGLSPPEQSFLS